MGHRFGRHRRTGMLAAAGALLTLAACASGESILNAGNDPTTTTAPPSTATPGIVTGGGGGVSPTTIDLTGGGGGVSPTTIDLIGGGGGGVSPTTIDLMGGGAGANGMRRRATPPAIHPCPLDALDSAAGPVHVTFWHTMTNVLEDELVALTNEYNASQDRVVVELQNQNGYSEVIDKYFQSSDSDRPNIVQMPEYMVQQMADTNSVIPAGACIQTEGYDIAPFVPRVLLQYQTGGIQWSMPFNVSGPVLYYNRKMFEAAGLDPDDPPITLDQVRDYSQRIVDADAATYGWAVDTGVDSGGGWFIEQWFARLGIPYSDNGNGREARSTEVYLNQPESVELLTFVQSMVTDGLAVNVGDNPSAQDVLLKMADPNEPAAMGVTTSAGLGTVISVTDAGLIPGITSSDIGVGPMPGPSETPSALVGGASLYIVANKDDAQAAAAWDFIKYLVSAEAQSTWAAGTGYVPVREDATEIAPYSTTLADDPRFGVAFQQLVVGDNDLNAVGPALGPLRQIREVTAQSLADIFAGADVRTTLDAATRQANLLIIDYNNRNP
jgi:sn-glycerol 3-phosphate transport system substrate-binding protein